MYVLGQYAFYTQKKIICWLYLILFFCQQVPHNWIALNKHNLFM